MNWDPEDDVFKPLWSLLCEKMEYENITVKEVAKEVGLSGSTIVMLRKPGYRANTDTIVQVCDWLGIDSDTYIEEQ